MPALSATAVALLEVVAAKRPEILPWLLADAPLGSVGSALARLAQEWRVPAVDVPCLADRAARHLALLEKKRQTPDPGSVRGPDLAALLHFTLARLARLADVRRRRHLERLARELHAAVELAQKRREIESFIGLDRPEEEAGDLGGFGSS